MAKTLTEKQMHEAEEEGDEFEFPDDGHRSIEGFDMLVKEIRALVEAQRANAAADILRSENMENMATLIQRLLDRPAGSGQMDMTPLRDLLREMQETTMTYGQAAFEFTVKRDQNGFMQTITATPIQPTQH